MIQQLRNCVLVLACLLGATEGFAADIDGIRLWRAPDSTRLVLDLTGQVDYKVFSLKSPHRVVIDITQAKLATATDNLPLKDTPIQRVRVGKRGKNGLRLVLDMQQAVTSNAFTLKKHGGKPDRLVVDLLDRMGAAPVVAAPKPAVKVQDLMDMVPKKRDIVVAVDAGHGGGRPRGTQPP